MGTVPGAAGGAVTGQKNMGLPVLGGQAGKNQYSPTSGIPTAPVMQPPTNGVRPVNTSPVASAAVTGQPPSVNAGGAMSGTPPPTAINTQPTAAQGTTAGGASTATSGTLAGYTPQQTQQLQKQLNDIYGKGEGGLLFSLFSNLGSNDSAYMDAYHTAMGKTQAEGLATIDTGLGNAGISANSSTAAIEKGDYLSGLSAQEGLQEQQLIQNQTQEAIGLTQGLQQDASAENSTSWLNTAAQVVGIGATLAGVPGAAGSLGSLFNKGGGGSVPNIASQGTTAAQLPSAVAPTQSGVNSPLAQDSYAGSLPIF